MALTEQGLQIETQEEVLQNIVTSQQQNISPSIDVDDDTSLGQQNQIIAAQIALINQLAQDVYDQRNILLAEGKALDDAVTWLGIKRQAAAATTGEQHFVGDDGTNVPSGTILQNISTQDLYNLDTALLLTKDACRTCTFEVLNIVDSTQYTVTIQGVDYQFTADGDATAQEIITGLVGEITGAVGVNYTAVDNGDETATISVTDDTDLTVAVDTNLSATKVTSVGNITAQKTGPLPSPAGTVITIITPIGGLDSTFNKVALTIGRNIETDVELRNRAINFQTLSGTATVDSIEVAILNVTGVSSATVNERFVSQGVEDTVVTIENILDTTVYTLTLNGVNYTYTSDASATDDEITAGLTSAVNAGKDDFLATDNMDGTLTVSLPNAYRMSVGVDANMSYLEGQTAGSIQVVVAGGNDDDEIAQAIWDTKPAGVEVWAVDDATRFEGTAVDNNGDPQIIPFNRSTQVLMVVNVTYKVFDETQYPSDDDDAYDAIKEAVVQFGNGNYEAGEDVVPNQFLATVLCAVNGIYDVEVVINGESSDNPANVVVIDSNEEAFFDEDQVTVINVT